MFVYNQDSEPEHNSSMEPFILSQQQQQQQQQCNGEEQNHQHHHEMVVVVNYDRTIVRLSVLYLLLIVLLFAWPQYISAHWNGEGLALVGEIMGIVIFVGGSALLISVVVFGITIRRWKAISPWMKVIGILPITCSILLMVYTQVLVEMDQRKHQDDDIPICDGEDCPKRKDPDGGGRSF